MKFKNILFKLSGALCSFAFLMALSSLDTMCIGTYHQPEVPESLTRR